MRLHISERSCIFVAVADENTVARLRHAVRLRGVRRTTRAYFSFAAALVKPTWNVALRSRSFVRSAGRTHCVKVH